MQQLILTTIRQIKAEKRNIHPNGATLKELKARIPNLDKSVLNDMVRGYLVSESNTINDKIYFEI